MGLTWGSAALVADSRTWMAGRLVMAGGEALAIATRRLLPLRL